MRTLADIRSVLADPRRLWNGLVWRLKTRVARVRPRFEAVNTNLSTACDKIRDFLSQDKESEFSQLPKSYFWAWVRFLRGAWVHARTGETPRSAHFALLALFIKTGGRANDVM